MPWKECHVVDERVRFVARLLDGDKMVLDKLAQVVVPAVLHLVTKMAFCKGTA